MSLRVLHVASTSVAKAAVGFKLSIFELHVGMEKAAPNPLHPGALAALSVNFDCSIDGRDSAVFKGAEATVFLQRRRLCIDAGMGSIWRPVLFPYVCVGGGGCLALRPALHTVAVVNGAPVSPLAAIHAMRAPCHGAQCPVPLSHTTYARPAMAPTGSGIELHIPARGLEGASPDCTRTGHASYVVTSSGCTIQLRFADQQGAW